jgi:hypothetical protein
MFETPTPNKKNINGCGYILDMAFLYTNNAEYRELFRKITNQSPINLNGISDEDDKETLDESTYDESAVGAFLDTIYEHTRNHPLFQQAYLAAAAKMITEDPQIGLAILMSYDYLWAFYPCYCAYRENPETFSETEAWLTLKNTGLFY